MVSSLNAMGDGTCRLLKAQYGNTSVQNFESQGTFGGSGVIKVRQATKKGYIECVNGGVVDITYPGSTTRRGRVIDMGNVSPTLMTESMPGVLEKFKYEVDGEEYLVRIRKLTPKECWRLMGFTDEDFDKASKVNSNTQLYKQAGNSICVPVIEHIIKQML